jgi:hypothetical protein
MSTQNDPQDPLKGFLQIYLVTINGIDYALLGPCITPNSKSNTLVIEEFKLGELVPNEVVVHALRRGLEPDSRAQLMKKLQ